MAHLLLELGQGAFTPKIDVASAYRIVPVHPLDRYFLGMVVYMDKQLPFGLSSAPVLFNAYADGLEWIARVEG